MTAERQADGSGVVPDAPDDGEREQRIRDLVDAGAEIAGGAVGGALGFLAAGPLGAAALGAGGAAVGRALRHIGSEACERLLGPREKVRVGAVLAISAEEIAQRLGNGEKIREDGFFDEKTEGRSSAVEVAESVLLKSQREPEEKKIPYMARLLSSVAFDESISAEMAHQVAKASEQLTYRQLCLMRLTVIKDALGLRKENYRGQGGVISKELYQVLYECLDLYHRGFVNLDGEVAFGPTDIAPGKMSLQGLGVDAYNLMQLWKIPAEDLFSVGRVFMEPGPSAGPTSRST